MNTRVRITLIAISAVALLFVIRAWKRPDIPAPDTADLLLEVAKVPEEDNAFTYFVRAAAASDWPEDESRVSSILFDGQWEDTYVADLLSRNAEALALLARGLACPAYQPYGASTLETPRPSYLWPDDVSRLMAVRAVQERRAGRTERVWQSCFDQCRFGSCIAARPRATVEYMSAMVVLGRGLEEVKRLLGGPPLGEEELAKLLDQLDNIGALDQGLVRAVKAHFQFITEMIDELASDTAQGRRRTGYLFQPNRAKDAAAGLCRAVIENAVRPYGEVSLSAVKPVRVAGIRRYTLFLRRNSVGEIMTGLFVSPEQVRNLLIVKCRTQSCLDGLRLVVACRLYEMRHGRLPETLDVLVPQYLPEVPRDPFDGRPFRYLPDRALVYAVGWDLTDSSIAPSLTSDARSGGNQRSGDDLGYAIHE